MTYSCRNPNSSCRTPNSSCTTTKPHVASHILSKGACTTAAERFQNLSLPIYSIQKQMLVSPHPPAEPPPRSGWNNKPGSDLQLPGLLWEPTPKRPKRLIETLQSYYLPLFCLAYRGTHSKAAEAIYRDTIKLLSPSFLPGLSRKPPPERSKRLTESLKNHKKKKAALGEQPSSHLRLFFDDTVFLM